MGSIKTFFKSNDLRIKELAIKFSPYKENSKRIEYRNALEKIKNWLDNFHKIGFKNIEIALQLLEKIEFIKSDEICAKLLILAQKFLDDDQSFICPLGEESESSFRITAHFNQRKNFSSTLTKALDRMPGSSQNKLLLFDDFLNSGGQIITIFHSLLNLPMQYGEINDEGDKRTTLNETQIEKLRLAEIHIFYYKAFDEGVDSLKRKISTLKLNITVHRYLSATENDGLFGDLQDQKNIEDGVPGKIQTNCPFAGEDFSKLTELYTVLKNIGEALLRANEQNWSEEKYVARALGYSNQSRIIITDYNIPTVSLTALWQHGEIFYKKKQVYWNAFMQRRKKKLYVETKQFQVNQLTNTSSFEDIHTLITSKYLKGDFKIEVSNLKEKELQYTKLFSLISIIKHKGLISTEIGCNNIFEELTIHILQSSNTSPLLVKGLAGCGKTSFLSLLYLNMYEYIKQNNINKLPVFVNLHYYNKKVYPGSIRNYYDEALLEITKDIAIVEREIQRNEYDEVIVIIDGADEYINPKVDLHDFIYKKMNLLIKKKQIVGLRRHKDKNSKSFKKQKPIIFIGDPEIEIELTNIETSQNEFNLMIEYFTEIEHKFIGKGHTTVSEYLHNKIKQFKIEKIDLFYLRILLEGLKNNYIFQDAKTLSEYYTTYFEQKQIKITEAAELAFQTYNNPESIPDKDKNNIGWWSIQRHDSMRDFLVAYHVINKLIEFNQKSSKQLNYVYPFDLNGFCKEILNSTKSNQEKVYKSIKGIIDSQSTIARTHLCYLLGRFEDVSIIESSKAYLKIYKSKIEKSIIEQTSFDTLVKLDSEKKLDLLHLRTVFISLVFLGEHDISREYIALLLKNKNLDDLNRGFHLEYYGDIPFDPASLENLRHEDNLKRFDHTFEHLYKKLFNALENDKMYSMFEIDMYTLCSLAQQRHIVNNLEEFTKSAIQSLVSSALSRNINVCIELNKYLNFISYIFNRDEKMKTGTFIQDLYALKNLKRSGWVVRNIRDPETVAAHMYGAFVLGLFFLPAENTSYKEYSKEKILKMLLIHDLGEAYVGDLLPSEKNYKTERIERMHINHLSLLGTYEGISNLSDLITLYDDFTKGNDINSSIAKDLDKLENLLQLYLYNNDSSQSKIEDFDFFQNELITAIQTEQGKKIKQIILNLFKE